jgi:intraflagellar transport protein 56
VLPPLVDVFPEAKLNLIIYYLKNDDINEAYNLAKDLQPTQAREYIIKVYILIFIIGCGACNKGA